MSWNILPKNVLQYFLTKLKGLMYTKTEVDNLIPDSLSDLSDDSTHRLVTDTEKTAWSGKSVVSANPQSTTGTLSGLEIDGVGYAVQGGDVSGKYDKITQSGVGSCICDGQSEYFKIATLTITETNINGPIGFEVSQTFNQVTLLQIGFAKTDNTDPDVAWFYTNQRNNYWIVKENTSVWGLYGQFENTVDGCSLHRIVGYRVNNGVTVTVNLTNVSALPSGATQPTYGGSVNYANIASRAASATDSTKVAKAGDTMTGCLIVKATGAAGNYDEGIRINAGKNGYASLCIGGAENSTTGTSEGQFWIGTNPTNNSYKRKLYIAQNGSTGSGTYFEAGSSSVTSPSLHMGNTISMNGNDIHLNTNGSSSNDTSDIVWWYGNGREKARLWCNDSYTSESGLNFRMFNSSGNQLFTGTIPLRDHTYSVGNGTLTLQRNGSTIASFTANQSGNTTANFTDTNNAVTVTHSNSNAEYPLCFEGHNNATTYTTGIYKCTSLTVNPYHVYLYVKHTSNGTYTIINSTGIYFRNDTSARIWCDGNQQIWIAASSESDYKLFLGVANKSWMFGPGGNGRVTLGQASYRWGQIYSTNASISTSDRKEKKDIVPLDDSAVDFIMALNPVSYKMINGDSGRTHYGMIAQDVEEELEELGMTAMDFAGFCKDQKYERYEEVVDKVTTTRERKVEGEYIYGLRYEEFIAPLIKTVQLQQQEIEELKHRIDILEGK